MRLNWISLISQSAFNEIIEHFLKLKEDKRITFTNSKDKLDYLKEFDEVIKNLQTLYGNNNYLSYNDNDRW